MDMYDCMYSFDVVNNIALTAWQMLELDSLCLQGAKDELILQIHWWNIWVFTLIDAVISARAFLSLI